MNKYYITIAIMVCVGALLPHLSHANSEMPIGGVCECEAEAYSLQVVAWPQYGSVTVEPEKDFYQPGEMVVATFTPAENCGFASWSCEPNSLYASGCPLTTTIVKITDDTVLTAIPRGPGTINVAWDPRNGDVTVSGDTEVITETSTTKIVRATGELFSTITISPNPNEGRGVFMDSLWVQFYGESAEVPILSGEQGVGVYFPLVAEMPTLMGPFCGSVMGAQGEDAGGYIRMGDNHSGGSPWGAPAYLSESTMASVEAEINVWLEPGYFLDHWTFAGSTGNDTETTLRYAVWGSARDFTAELRKAVMLDLQIEGGGYVTSDAFMVYYDPANATSVQMHAVPCSGFSFDHWEQNCGDEGWEDAGYPGFPVLTVTMNEEVQVKAVFTEWCGCGGPDGRDILRAMYQNPDVVDSDNAQYSPRPSCEDLVTNIQGHAQEYVNPGNFSFADLSCRHNSSEGEHVAWQWDGGVSSLFQDIRDEYGAAITVTSAYRCPIKNNAVPSKASSDHAYGRAFDWDQNDSAANWDVAVDASIHADTTLLYCGPGRYRTYESLVLGGFGPGILPEGWTEYTNGHAGID